MKSLERESKKKVKQRNNYAIRFNLLSIKQELFVVDQKSIKNVIIA